ncbi:MAG: urease subunit gamma [Firmicutes bacterium]|nr:urease subunit gamma [Bacillota bacterium]
MKLTTHEQERVLLFGVAEISRRRWKRGVKLNYIEASSIIMDELLERGRAGVNDITELMEIGAQIIPKEDCMDGIEAMLPIIMFEVQFPDGNKLVSVHDPIRLETRAETIPEEELLSMNY